MKKYTNFKALDFAENPDFISWVQNGFHTTDQRWDALKAQSPILSNEIDEAIEIVSIFQIKPDSPIDKAKETELLNRIEASIASPNESLDPKPEKKTIVKYIASFAIAASIAAMVLIYYPQKSMETFATLNETKVQFDLPDNSSVLLDAHSNILYDASNFLDTRHVKLEGQAFFKIQKGKPFIVETDLGNIEVLGTTFNVNQKGRLQVHCVTGKVKVSNSTSSVILTQGEICTMENNEFIKRTIEQQDLVWFKTKINFENEKLGNVIQKLEKEYHVKILASEEIKSTTYTGFFETGNLEASLKAITWPLRLSYEVSGETVKIKK